MLEDRLGSEIGETFGAMEKSVVPFRRSEKILESKIGMLPVVWGENVQ